MSWSCVHTADDTILGDARLHIADAASRDLCVRCGSRVYWDDGELLPGRSVTIPTGRSHHLDSDRLGRGAYLQHLRGDDGHRPPASGDLDVTLRPQLDGRDLDPDNGGKLSNVFNGQAWDDDDAEPGRPSAVHHERRPATDHPYANNVVAANLVSGRGSRAFDGENPNGVWTLRVSDDTARMAARLSSCRLR